MIAAVIMVGGLAVAAGAANDEAAPTQVPPSVAVQRVSFNFLPVRDEAAMVLVGAGLIGVAAAVRRAA